MARLEQIGRRTWFGRLASSGVALWAGLHAGRGPETWMAWVGGEPGRAAAQEGAASTFSVEMELEFEGNFFPLAAFVVVRGREIAVVDALIPGNAERIGATIAQLGLDWRSVRHLILTHWHFDHVGSLGELADRAPQATIWAGAPDIPQVEAPRTIYPVYDGDEVFGLQVIATPGHTLGHISLLDPVASSVLVGDAVFNLGGELGLPPPDFGEDLAETLVSVGKLGALGFERALFSHGVTIESGAAALIGRLAVAASHPEDVHALVDHRHNCLLHA